MKGIIYFILIPIIIVSCKKEETEIIDKKIKASYEGLVLSEGNDNSDFKVEITNEKDFHEITYTDSLGLYRFENLDFGLYNIIFSKTGYGTFKRYEVYVSGLYVYTSDYVRLYPINQSVINSIDSIPDPGKYYYLDIFFKMTLDNYRKPDLLVVFSKNSDCNIDNFDYSLILNYSRFNPADELRTYFTLNYLVNNGFSKGDKVYFRLYPKDTGDKGYFDYNLNKFIFSTANVNGGSELCSFVISDFISPY
jgi:hypothetical protein